MIIRCDNCSVSLQLDEAKIPTQNFTVRCPRCQNLIRVQKGQRGHGSATVQQLEANLPAPAVAEGSQQFSAKEQEFDINSALRTLITALQKDTVVRSTDDDKDERPRRVLLCLGQKRDEVGKVLVDAGFKVYVAQTPAQANERMREGKTEILIFSPDFAAASPRRGREIRVPLQRTPPKVPAAPSRSPGSRNSQSRSTAATSAPGSASSCSSSSGRSDSRTSTP